MGILDYFRREAKEEDDARRIAELVINDLSDGASREDELQKLMGMGLCQEQSDAILDMVEMAHGRATMLYMGIPQGNMSSNVDDDPYFRAAVKIFTKRMPPRKR